MTPPSQPIPIHSDSSSSRPASDALLQHSDFMGATSPSYQYLDTLDCDYTFTVESDPFNAADLPSGAAAVEHYDTTSWSQSAQIQNSLLLGDASTTYDLNAPPPTPINVHDSYYQQFDTVYGATSASGRVLPRIQVATEQYPLTPASSTQYTEAHSPWTATPSPSNMLPPSFPHSSPSSIGSAAPPFTPDTPYYHISPFSSPYIQPPSTSPVSPSHIAGVPIGYDPNCPSPLSQIGSSEESLTVPTASLQLPRAPVPNVLELAHVAGHPLGLALVPQTTYRPHTLSDRRRYVEEVDLEQPIMFYSHGPDGCGIPLEDAIKAKFSKLRDRDDAMFEGRGPSVSIRLNWPGYAPWSRQIPTRDFRSPPQPITRAKLAKNVAKTIARFIKEMEGQRQEDGADSRWRVGGRHINLENLMLVGLQHVSMGSWQAHVRLMRRV